MKKEGRIVYSKRITGVIAIFVLVLTLIMFFKPGGAMAKTDYSDSATSLEVTLVTTNPQTSATVTRTVYNYTFDDMENLASGPVGYSSIDAMPACVYTVGYGVFLNDLINDAASHNPAVSFGPGGMIKLYATDNWTHTYTYEDLLGTGRYYYPNLFAAWDRETQTLASFAEDGAVSVEPMLAIESYQTRIWDGSEPSCTAFAGMMNREESFRFCLGMASDELDPSVSTTAKYGRWVYRMDIILPGSIDDDDFYNSVTGLSLDKESVEIEKGKTIQLTAKIMPDDATDQGVIWSSNKSQIAKVDNEGLVTGLSVGTAEITATAAGDTDLKKTCTVTVKESNIAVTGISLDKSSITITRGKTKQLTALVLPSDAANKNIAWSSSDTGIATVDNNGLVTAKATGTVTITATTEDGSFKAACAVSVVSKSISASSLELSEKAFTLKVQGSRQLVATITPSNATETDLLWSSDKPSVATVGPDGLVTAKGEGTATITATTEDRLMEATCTVTVVNVDIPLTSVTLNKKAIKLGINGTKQLKVIFVPSNATNRDVAWDSDDPGVATVDAHGFVSAIGAGSAVITVTAQDGLLKGTCAVTVTETNLPTVFTDISGIWAADDIMEMVEFGILSGYEDGSFRPDGAVTRAEFVAMVVHTLEKLGQLTVNAGESFADTRSHWAEEYISTAVSCGFVAGYDEDTFGPNENITREQMAVIIARAFDLSSASGQTAFSDTATISAWAYESVAAVVESGIMTGMDGNLFAPQEKATRAQAATVIQRILRLKGYM